MGKDQASDLQQHFVASAKVDINEEAVTFDDGNFLAQARGGAVLQFFGMGNWTVIGFGDYGNVCFGIPQQDIQDAIPVISEKLAEIKMKLDHAALKSNVPSETAPEDHSLS